MAGRQTGALRKSRLNLLSGCCFSKSPYSFVHRKGWLRAQEGSVPTYPSLKRHSVLGRLFLIQVVLCNTW